MGNGTFAYSPCSGIPLSTCGTTSGREDLGSCQRAEETQCHQPFSLHSHSTGATMMPCTGQDDKEQKQLAETQTQAAEM